MKKRWVVMLACVAACVLARPMSGQSAEIDMPDRVRQQFQAAYNARDIEKVVSLYAEDATLASDGGLFHGRDQIRIWVQSGVEQGSVLEAIETSAEGASATLAYSTGKTRRRVGSVIHLGQFLIVMQKRQGEWKITQHFSISAGQVKE